MTKESIQSTLVDFATLQGTDLKQHFQIFLSELFGFDKLIKAGIEPLLPLNANPALSAFSFKDSIIYFTTTDSESHLQEAQSGHTNLAFSLIPTSSHHKADLVSATKAINRVIPSYNILFFLSADTLSIAFATRRLSHATKEKVDVVEKITLIKDISLHTPHPAHIQNLHALTNLYTQDLPLDRFYQSLLEALSIETLNDKFFKEIRERFLDFCDTITLPQEMQNAQDKEFIKLKREFVLRLLSRLLFCQFLEKKGLISPALWDTNLSEHYYHEVCEPLFFGTLNTHADKRDYGFLPQSIIALLDSIPYLNGGLFAPHTKDYYEVSKPQAHINTLKIPNSCFDELFETFRAYHFTLSESTPLTQEVGLDPELLGMVFENLLSVLFTDNLKDDKDLRKATGSYYTPREIVAYMCASSLCESLKNRTNIAESTLERLVFDKDASSVSSDEAREILSVLDSLKILDPACGSGAFPLGMLSELLEIQNALSEHSVCELFSGSASDASLRSMSNTPHSFTSHNPKNSSTTLEYRFDLHDSQSPTASVALATDPHLKNLGSLESRPLRGAEIVDKGGSSASTRLKLEADKRGSPLDCRKSGDFFGVKGSGEGINPFLREKENKDFKRDSSQLTQETSRLTLYERKLRILQNNIFGVDIQPMATEIARLRCFLSLICDAPNEDIQPLPNLEFKFISANSLIPLPKQEGLAYDGYKSDMDSLKALRERTFDAQNKQELESAYLKLRNEIAKKMQSVWHTSKGDFSSNPLLSWNPFDPHSVAEFFDSEWMFGVKAAKNAAGGGALNVETAYITQGWDIVLGNPPYGATYPNAHKNLFKAIYMSALSIKNIQKGSLDTFSMFIEMGFNALNGINGLCSFIVPMSVTASESMVGIHKILLENCQKIWISSYGDRPQKIFKNAEQKVSIITFVKTFSSTQKLMMTKVNKRYAIQQVSDVIKNLHFVNGIDFVKKGRFPKISFEIECNILHKIHSHTDSIKNYISTQGMPIYYRTSGNRYYNLITTFPTHSTKEKHFKVSVKYQKLIGAILSSNLYFWFRSIYSNQRDTYLYEFEIMPFPIDNFSQSDIDRIEKIYNAFELDIENKANFTSTGTKEYRLRKSKSFIDEIDCAICGAYGLNEEERDFIINYDIEFRTD